MLFFVKKLLILIKPKHNTGALCTRLATEASAVQGASGVRFGLIFQNIFSIGVGIIIGFVFSWQLTLLIFGFVPLIIIWRHFTNSINDRFARKDKENLEDAGKV